MKDWVVFILILALIAAGFYIIILKDRTQDLELLQVETQALYKIKADLELELIRSDKKTEINEIHEKYRQEFVNSDFADKLEHIRLSDLEALRVFDRYSKRGRAD